MAKIKLSAIVSDMRGKLNGSVFAKNRAGAYVRNKVTPVNPQSTYQMTVRGIFASISSGWSSLSQDGRNSFNNRVSQYATTDIFGDLRNPSGKSLYQRLNQNRQLTGQAILSECPDSAPVPFANTTEATFDLSTTSYDIVTAGDTSGCKIMVFATGQLSQGTKFVKNDLRFIEYFNGGNGVTVDIYSAYNNKFGAPAVGDNIYVGVRVINANGQASPIETIKANVVNP